MHVHSTYSDGTNTPKELVEIALKNNLCAIALTDHDTIDGLAEIIQCSKNTNLKIIPGIELSTGFKNLEQDVHILGYNINYNETAFVEHIENFQKERDNRNKTMIERMKKDGIDISYEKITLAYPDAVITRAHFARFLMEKGYVSSVREGITKFLSKTSKYYVSRTLITPAQAVEIIKKAGGKAVLAHPLLYGLSDTELNDLIKDLKNYGLDGIEAIYSLHSPDEESYVKKLASKHNLLLSGGSDYHGSNKPDILLGKGKGNLQIPYSLLKKLGLL